MEKVECVANLKLEIRLESHLTGRCLSPKNTLFNGKISFLWLANSGVKPPFFRNQPAQITKIIRAGQVKRKVNSGELSVEKTLLGLPHIV